MSTTFDNDNITFDNNNTTFDNLPAPTTSKIKLKKSSVPEKVPLAGDLEYGELALNFADGKLYFKNSVNEIESFLAGASSAFGTLKSFLFIATQGQDTFTGSDNSSETLSYNPDYVDVFVNGIRLNKQDYNTPNSQTIVLNTAVTVNDEVAVTTTEVTGSAVNGTNTRQVFTATEAQTVFVLTKDYDIGFIDVYQNGVKLVNDVDVDVSSGTEIVLTTGAASGDTIDVVSFAGVVIADHFTKTESDNRFLPQVDPTFTGTLSGGTIDATVTYDNAVSGLAATNVQAAIDEVTGDLANIDLAASNVTYNNSTSGLTATDVQAAIDEVTGDLGTMSTQDANNVNVSGGSVSGISLSTSSDANIFEVTVGRGGGNVSSNTAIGRNALSNNTTGEDNTAIGQASLRENTTGIKNTAIGQGSLRENTTGDNNTAIGRNALPNNTTGEENTAIGVGSLRENTTGNNNMGLGRSSGRSSSPFTVTTQDNRIIIGNNNHTDAYIRIAFTVTSDARDKAEINPIPLGLDFVNQLKPTEYQFKAGDRDGEPDGRRRYGFLAQDVLAAEGSDPVIVDAEDDENLKLHESYLVPVLVNAIKELTARIAELEKKS